MPDRDIFQRNVRRGWQSAARLVLSHDSDPTALRAVIRALGRELKKDGCPGLDTIVAIVVDALQSGDRQLARQRAHEQLDCLVRDLASDSGEVVAAAAERLVAQASSWYCDDALPETVSVHLLSEFADACMCSAPMLGLLVEEGDISFQTLQSRRDHAKRMLIAAPETRRLAAMLLADPSGASVTTPRMRRSQMSQADILVFALTEK